MDAVGAELSHEEQMAQAAQRIAKLEANAAAAAAAQEFLVDDLRAQLAAERALADESGADASQARRALEEALADNSQLARKLQEAESDAAKNRRQRAKVGASNASFMSLSTKLQLASAEACQAKQALEKALATNAELTRKLQEAESGAAKSKKQRAKVAAQESRVIKAGMHVKSVEEELRRAEAQLALKLQEVQSDLRKEAKAHKRTKAMVTRLTTTSDALKLSHAEATETVTRERANSLRLKQRVEGLEAQLKASQAMVAAKHQELDDSLQKQLEQSRKTRRSVSDGDHAAGDGDTAVRPGSDCPLHRPQMHEPQSSVTSAKDGRFKVSRVERPREPDRGNGIGTGAHDAVEARKVASSRSVVGGGITGLW